MKSIYFFNIDGRLFTFVFCSLCPSCHPMIHSNVRNVFVSSPFLMLFVRACSPVSPEFPSMFAFTAVHSFILFSSKGSCSSVVFSFHRPTCLLFHVAMLSLPTQDFRKLALCLPPLFQLETHHSPL
jgi:hypothetical protein